MKKVTKLILLGIVAVFACMLMTGCKAVYVSGELTINNDGTGNRVIFAEIDKAEDKNDGWGVAYDYLTKHGAALQSHLVSVMSENVPGSESWLTISVDDGAAKEVITFSFNFSSIDDYLDKMNKLAFDKEGALAINSNSQWFVPTYVEEDGIATYTEHKGVMTAIANSVFCALIDDGTYDETCAGKRTEADSMGYTPESQVLADQASSNTVSGRIPLIVKMYDAEQVGVDIDYNDASATKYYMVTSAAVPVAAPGGDNTGNEGTGNEGTGNEGTGNEGTGNEGTGNEGTGNEGTGNEGTGNEGTGNEGTGNAGTGNEGTGNAGTGNAGTGNAGTGNAPSTGETMFAGVVVAIMCIFAFVGVVTFKKARN